MGCYICITDVQKSIDKISGQAKQGAVYYIIYLSRRKICVEIQKQCMSGERHITGTYRLCADKVVCKRVYEVERILLN